MKKDMVWKAKKEDQASCLNLNLVKQGCGFIGSLKSNVARPRDGLKTALSL